MQGELDWVVMKAIEKDRVRRYETVNELTADVSRFLANEPLRLAHRRWYTGSASLTTVIGRRIGLRRQLCSCFRVRFSHSRPIQLMLNSKTLKRMW